MPLMYRIWLKNTLFLPSGPKIPSTLYFGFNNASNLLNLAKEYPPSTYWTKDALNVLFWLKNAPKLME